MKHLYPVLNSENKFHVSACHQPYIGKLQNLIL